MKHLFKPKVFNAILALLVLLLIIKTIWFAVQILWLPVKGINEVSKQASKALYYRVKLTPNEVAAPVKITKTAPVKQEGNIKEIKLLAIYSASDATIVTVEYKAKAKVLSRGDKINGFVLEGGGNNFAIFSKNAKTYKVFLGKGKAKDSSSSTSVKENNTKTKSPSTPLGEITDAGDHRVIDRSLLEHYAKNMDDIYKNIGITEVKEGGEIKGFRITFVRKDSPFEKLGIRREDMIKSINGQEINSYNAAFEMYKNIQDAENLTLVVQRGKEEMELEYEIN